MKKISSSQIFWFDLIKKSALSALFFLFLSYGKHTFASPEAAEKLGGSEYCGLCHTDIYHQWNASSHHFSSFNNPIYQKVIKENVGLENIKVRKFCSNCHDPILKTADQDEIDINSWQANSGITCLSCHRIAEFGEKNGDYKIKEPFLHPFSLANSPTLRKAHEVMVDVSPWLHKAMLTKDTYKTSEFCAVCHTLEVPEEINGYTSLTIFNEYDSWSKSPFSGKHISHHAKENPNCQNCHMPLVASNDPAAIEGMVHDHSFAAGNTGLPSFNRDYEHLEKVEAFLTNNIIKARLHKLKINHTSWDLNTGEPQVNSGDTLTLDIGVRSQGIGHHFPGGTADSNEAWVSILVFDENNTLISQIGVPDKYGPLPESTYRFGVDFVDIHGNITNRGTSTTKGVNKQLDTRIPPSEEVFVPLELKIPEFEGNALTISVSVNWRKYNPEFIKWVYDGRWEPDIPITELDVFKFKLLKTKNSPL